MNAYGSGRHAEMTREENLDRRPYWQVRTVNDGPPRQRATHRAAHMIVVLASDPAWKRAFAPFGFNCRCRIVSLKGEDVQAKGLTVSDGSALAALPDDGFAAGTPSLIG
jgi:uncharacterized protein with gpF-like domain